MTCSNLGPTKTDHRWVFKLKVANSKRLRSSIVRSSTKTRSQGTNIELSSQTLILSQPWWLSYKNYPRPGRGCLHDALHQRSWTSPQSLGQQRLGLVDNKRWLRLIHLETNSFSGVKWRDWTRDFNILYLFWGFLWTIWQMFSVIRDKNGAILESMMKKKHSAIHHFCVREVADFKTIRVTKESGITYPANA